VLLDLSVQGSVTSLFLYISLLCFFVSIYYISISTAARSIGREMGIGAFLGVCLAFALFGFYRTSIDNQPIRLRRSRASNYGMEFTGTCWPRFYTVWRGSSVLFYIHSCCMHDLFNHPSTINLCLLPHDILRMHTCPQPFRTSTYRSIPSLLFQPL
jgi:hypothetical protein